MGRLQTSSRPVNRWLAAVVLLVWCGLLVFAAANRQNILDWWKLRSYHAPAQVVALANDDELTPYARRIFYVNEPQIDSKNAFNAHCPAGHEQTVVLGCYHGDQNGIFVLSVTDARLSGIEQVTAAHEMLHAAYDRLNAAERKSIDAELSDFFNHGLQDKTIIDQINGYKKTEPDQLLNEMHSILGTEVSKLPAPLEQYYARYFTDRAKVTGMYAQYQSAFTSRQAQIESYDAQLAALKTRITDAEASASAQEANLASQRSQLDSERAKGNIAAYNAGVPAYNAAVDAYNAQVAAIHQLVQQYNDIVQARNAIALEEQQLANDITSSVSPIGQ